MIAKAYIDRIRKSEIGLRIIRGAFWSAMGQGLSKLLVLLTAIFIARILGKIAYGEMAILRSTVNMFTVIVGTSFGMTATKYIAEYRDKDIERLGRLIALSNFIVLTASLIIALVFFVLSSNLASSVLKAPQLENELKIVAVVLFFSSLNAVQMGIWLGFERFKEIAFLNIFASLISLLGQTVGANFWGINGAIIGYSFFSITQFFLNYYFLSKFFKKSNINLDYQAMFREKSIIWRFGLPSLLSGIMVMPIMWFINVMLVNQSNGFQELAIYDAANQWQALIIFIPSAASQIVLPLLANNVQSKMTFKKVIKYNIILNFLVSLFMTLLISVFSKSIMSAFGKGFGGNNQVLIVLCGVAILISVNNVIGQAIAAQGRMWMGLLLNGIWGLTLMGFAYVFISHKQGALGIALAYFLSYIMHTIWQMLFLKNTVYRDYQINT